MELLEKMSQIKEALRLMVPQPGRAQPPETPCVETLKTMIPTVIHVSSASAWFESMIWQMETIWFEFSSNHSESTHELEIGLLRSVLLELQSTADAVLEMEVWLFAHG